MCSCRPTVHLLRREMLYCTNTQVAQFNTDVYLGSVQFVSTLCIYSYTCLFVTMAAFLLSVCFSTEILNHRICVVFNFTKKIPTED